MSSSHVEVTSITGDWEASEQRSFTPNYHTTELAIINREQRAFVVQDIGRSSWNHHSSCDCCNFVVPDFTEKQESTVSHLRPEKPSIIVCLIA